MQPCNNHFIYRFEKFKRPEKMQTNNKKKNVTAFDEPTQGDVVGDSVTLAALFCIIFFSPIVFSYTHSDYFFMQLNVY